MEFVSGITIKKILLHNGNWWKFFIKYRHLIRPAIIINVVKVLACRSKLLGFRKYLCEKCPFTKFLCFTCKSRFCSSCGKKATDQWIEKNFDVLPETSWQHITFTVPDVLWEFFWLNRHLLNLISRLAANIILDLAKEKLATPGIFTALHTFGRNLKRNVHIHLSVTLGGLAPSQQHWIKLFFDEKPIKTMWRYAVINLLREQYKSGNLILPPSLNHIKSLAAFNSWLNFLYNKKWYVNLQKSSKDHKKNVSYLGKYLKRPPLGETRILKYQDGMVTYKYVDHYDKTTQLITLSVMEFIARLVAHIPDQNFRLIRYYGWLSNRTRGKLLPVVFNLLKKPMKKAKTAIKWRDMIFNTFGIDPLRCPLCQSHLVFQGFYFGLDPPALITLHPVLAQTES